VSYGDHNTIRSVLKTRMPRHFEKRGQRYGSFFPRPGSTALPQLPRNAAASRRHLPGQRFAHADGGGIGMIANRAGGSMWPWPWAAALFIECPEGHPCAADGALQPGVWRRSDSDCAGAIRNQRAMLGGGGVRWAGCNTGRCGARDDHQYGAEWGSPTSVFPGGAPDACV
jgi:hypothetical protein